MVYKWKLDGLYDVSAQVAGEELSRIYDKRGKCDAADVVDESRPGKAVLHPLFEWNDPVAAELWREHQARGIIQCVVTTAESKKGEVMEVRAFHHVAGTYTPVNVVMETPDMESEMRANAFKEYMAFKRKMEAYSSLASVRSFVKAVDRAARRLKEEAHNAQTP